MISVTADDLHLHPRVAQQKLPPAAVRAVLDETLPRILPFRGKSVHSTVAILDWDHRLPSRALTLRVHILYDVNSRERFQSAFEHRKSEIAARDRYPEFDVPDYGGLPSDEAYDIELSGELVLEGMRLVSPWRREIAGEDGITATGAVRGSKQFAEVKRASPGRAAALGDLEAVAWTPPCESSLKNWTLDVWWLTSFDGRVGRGWSFLVDTALEPPQVMATREFSIRAA